MFQAPQLQINFYKITPLLITLAALSLWPCLVVDSYFVVIPVTSFMLLLALLITCKKANKIVFELISHQGFLYAILASLSATLLSASLLLVSYEAVHIDNTLNGLSMLRLSLIAGALMGVMTWVPISRRIGYKNIFMLKSFLISYALVTATIISQVNREFSGGEEKTVVRNVFEKKENKGGFTTYLTAQRPTNYIYISYDEALERLVVPTAVWDTLYKSATVDLTAKAGYFGYDYIIHFNGRTL